MITLVLSNKLTRYLLTIFFVSVFLFARSFMGIYIFGFRLGELVMGASLIFLLVALAQHKKLIYTNYLSRELYITVLLIILFLSLIQLFLTAVLLQHTLTSPLHIFGL